VLLSASLIVRNEEHCLEACISSLVGRVDEVVVVDTGSTDRSKEIARDFGARVQDAPWDGNFSAARNRGLDAAQGRWILYIDADECLTEFDRDDVESVFEDPQCAACRVLFRPATGYTRYRETRLFLKRRDLRFQGVIHESILPDLEELCRRQHMYVADSRIAIDHYGYDGDIRWKHQRNLPLLRERLSKDPHHVFSRDHLGQVLAALGDEAGAEQAFRAAIDSSLRFPSSMAVDSLPYLHLASLLMDLQRDSGAILDEAGRRFPSNHALTWLRARSAFEAGHYQSALRWFRRLAAVDAQGDDDGEIAYDTGIFGAPLHIAIGQCLFKAQRYAESEAAFAKAQKMEPDNLEIQAKRQFAALLAADSAG